MEPKRRGRLRTLAVVGGAALILVVLLGAVIVVTGSSGDRLTVYTARSHYGEEKPFKDFSEQTGQDVKLFGGKATELYERIRNEREDTEADVLITVDAANLWRAKEAGLLRPIRSAALEQAVPEDLRDSDGAWYGIAVRARTIMRSSERVAEDALATYEDLGDPRWKGRLCLRSGTSEYNVSFVADRLAKDGEGETRRMIERWMANEPQILGSDVDVLEAIAAGRCDVGLTNSYYLGRQLEDDPDFPVAPVWADQEGRGTHVNLSGVGVVRWARRPRRAEQLVEYLTRPEQQAIIARANHEFGVGDGIEPTEEMGRFGSFKRDPIDVPRAGQRLDDALALMSSLGWN